MQPTNHCRQMLKQLQPLLSVPGVSDDYKRVISNVVDLARASQKFMLPEHGICIDDTLYKALNENDELRLPYPFIAIEFISRKDWETTGSNHPLVIAGDYTAGSSDTNLNTFDAPKRIAFARDRDDHIVLTVLFCRASDGMWYPLPEIAIPKTGYLDRSRTAFGKAPIVFSAANRKIPAMDYADELIALMSFLNALQCSNVGIEKLPSTKRDKAKRKKDAIPFDEYHILTIASMRGDEGVRLGDHRSPREHLRRGHIRRLVDGRKIWVNATVVNAGIGGKITKDYAFKPRNSSPANNSATAQM